MVTLANRWFQMGSVKNATVMAISMPVPLENVTASLENASTVCTRQLGFIVRNARKDTSEMHSTEHVEVCIVLVIFCVHLN